MKSEGLRRLLTPFRWYVAPRAEGESIVGWWERRRIPYNAFVFLFNLPFAWSIDLYKMGLLKTNPAPGGDYIADPVFVVLAIQIIDQIMANIWYTGGWVVELLLFAVTKKHYRKFAPVALVAGTVFSLIFIMLLYGSFPSH